MFKKALLLLILCCLLSNFCAAQYEDDADTTETTDSSGNTNRKPLFTLKDDLAKGMEFMLTASGGYFYGELSPFVGIRPIKPFLIGAGVHGSFLVQTRAEGYYGVHGFGRLTIANAFFLQGEYRLLNGNVPGSRVRRQWVSSPIVGLGFMQGSGSWFLIGFAMNTDYQKINPFGPLIYRIGLYF